MYIPVPCVCWYVTQQHHDCSYNQVEEVGETHPDTARTLAGMAAIYELQKDPAKALEYYCRALSTQEVC